MIVSYISRPGPESVPDLSVRKATLKFGQSCPLAGSFPAALQCALHYADDFGEALRATAAVGGDNAARGAMIGSWLGAFHGIQTLPAGWCESLSARKEIESGVEWLVRMADFPGDQLPSLKAVIKKVSDPRDIL